MATNYFVLLFLSVIPAIFLGISLILGFMVQNYSPKVQAISQLVHSNLGKWQVLNFVICGLLYIFFAVYLQKLGLVVSFAQQLSFIGILAFGLCLFLVGIFPTDIKPPSTTAGIIHNLVFIGTVLIQIILQFVYSFSGGSNTYKWPFLISGAVTLLGFMAMPVWQSYRGFSQRILVLAIVFWLVYGVRLNFR